MGVDAFKDLEETIHVHVRRLSQDSTFDLFEFLSKFFFPKIYFKLRLRLICECGLCAGGYGNYNTPYHSFRP